MLSFFNAILNGPHFTFFPFFFYCFPFLFSISSQASLPFSSCCHEITRTFPGARYGIFFAVNLNLTLTKAFRLLLGLPQKIPVLDYLLVYISAEPVSTYLCPKQVVENWYTGYYVGIVTSIAYRIENPLRRTSEHI